MFEQTFVNTSAQTRRPWTVAASVVLQTGLVAIAFLAPLMHIAALQRPQPVPIWLPPQTLREQPPQPVASAIAPTVAATRRVFILPTLQAPTTVPPHIDMTPDAPEPPSAFAAVGQTVPPVFAGLERTTVPPVTKPAPMVKPTTPAATAPIHVGGAVQSAKLVFGPRPSYPHTALITRTQGTVRIQAIIGRDGSISNLQVISGHPLLIEAARQTVQQWRYQPTLLNGEPVEVVTEIDVNFAIGK